MILFEPTDYSHIYNLAFGDKLETSDNNIITIDDKINTDNGDRDKVLATVASAVYDYTNKYPDRWIIFSGSDEVRTRLYRMAITKNFAELCEDFHIFGLEIINDTFIRLPFDSKMNFTGFLIIKKHSL